MLTVGSGEAEARWRVLLLAAVKLEHLVGVRRLVAHDRYELTRVMACDGLALTRVTVHLIGAHPKTTIADRIIVVKCVSRWG
jgi:hypothetical protein